MTKSLRFQAEKVDFVCFLINCRRMRVRRTYGSKINFLVMLAPFFNWVIPLEVICGWMDRAGFQTVDWLDEYHFKNTRIKTAYHILGSKLRST